MQKIRFILLAGFATFITYFSMYAFRKPITAGLYEGLEFGGLDYKILIVTVQLIGYATAKVIGIKFISELSLKIRPYLLAGLICFSWIALIGFALVPPPYNFILMFFNGLPLGLIWGIVFSYVEGRKYTELLAAILSISFIVSSGAVKTIGRLILDHTSFSEFMMPMITGAMFIPLLGIGIWLLSLIPKPSEDDIKIRQVREPMTRESRRKLVRSFMPGLALTSVIYLLLTVFRDVRDNFAVDIWNDMGYLDQPTLLTTTEVVVALLVLIIAGSMYKIQENWKAFHINLLIIPLSAFTILISTVLFVSHQIHPIFWMILMGFGMYLPYITYHTMLLDRWIATFRIKGNVGFLMYIMDSVGYVTSLIILIFKNYFSPQMSWGNFFIGICWASGICMIVFGFLALAWFRQKNRVYSWSLNPVSQSNL